LYNNLFMLLDNKFTYNDEESDIKTVWEYIFKLTKKEGTFDIVTGFFTVAGLNILYEELSPNIKYRMILGDIMNDDDFMDHVIDLLEGDSGIENTLHLSQYAKNAVDFLRRETVEIKAINNSFCHAKTYIYRDKEDPLRDSYCITGSSNLTEAGLGLRLSSNVELNIAETGTSNSGSYQDLKRWFKKQWEEVAKVKIFIEPKNSKSTLVSVKEYFIKQIENIYREYTPEQIYYKILYELFSGDIDFKNDKNLEQEMTFLQDSEIYKTLFEYQKKGVISLVKMLRKYNGAILADAVGLGKTFSALAVMKYFQNNGYFVLVLCPKKLEQNWTQYLKRHNSRFERDRFDYVVRFHTDLQNDRLENSYDAAKLSYIRGRNKLLIVIDESHNLRNSKSDRYKCLLTDLIRYNPDKKVRDVKVLELSATPINTKLMDVRNQFNLIGHGDDTAFNNDNFSVESLQVLFKDAEAKFNQWCGNDNRVISDLISQLPPRFFNLTDKLIVARTRNLIEKTLGENLGFPEKLKPLNIYRSINSMGDYRSVNEIYAALMASNLSAYQPTKYLGEETKEEDWQNNQYRELYLVRMMIILFMKRLESSWYSCMITVGKVLDHHKNALEKVEEFLLQKKDIVIDENNINADVDEDDDEYTLSKAGVKLSEIKDIRHFKHDLKEDIKKLQCFYDNISKFSDDFNTGRVEDEKLDMLAKIITEKQKSQNKKVVIFTAYSDTAEFVYNQLKDKYRFDNIACVTGSVSMDSSSLAATKDFTSILQRFAPYSKLYKELDWSLLYEDNNCPVTFFDDDKRFWNVPYDMWKDYVRKYDKKHASLLDNNIDILVATDCLSEGQNLQDADMVINYDIHWNPVRLIQRFGRIDRIGSPNKTVQSVNFWPAKDYESYLHLEKRIEDRMSSMKLIGTETQAINEQYVNMVKDNPLLEKNAEKLLSQFRDNSISDIENVQSLGLQDLSFETFRQDLSDYLEKNQEVFKKMPNGIFTGFKLDDELFEQIPESLVAVVGYPHKPQCKKDFTYSEIYLMCQPVDPTVAHSTKYVEMNRVQILDMLRKNRRKETYIPQWITQADNEKVEKLSAILKDWMKKKVPQQAVKNIKERLKSKDFAPKDNILEEEKFKIENFDLIVWEYISKK
jgi:ERCC4-related helicase